MDNRNPHCARVNIDDADALLTENGLSGFKPRSWVVICQIFFRLCPYRAVPAPMQTPECWPVRCTDRRGKRLLSYSWVALSQTYGQSIRRLTQPVVHGVVLYGQVRVPPKPCASKKQRIDSDSGLGRVEKRSSIPPTAISGKQDQIRQLSGRRWTDVLIREGARPPSTKC